MTYSAFANSCPMQTDTVLFPLIHSHNILLHYTLYIILPLYIEPKATIQFSSSGCCVPFHLQGLSHQSAPPVRPIFKLMRLLTHVLCKPTKFFFHSFKATMSYSLQTSFNSLMKDWADKYHVWGIPTRSPSRSNSR